MSPIERSGGSGGGGVASVAAGNTSITIGGTATNPTVATTSLRKTTQKQVVNTVTETDLLNGEITVAANAIGASGLLRASLFGDWVNNTGGNVDIPRLRLKLGATTITDTGVVSVNFIQPDANRYAWSIAVTIMNLGATNSQWSTFKEDFGLGGIAATGSIRFVTGVGRASMLLNSAAPNAVLFWGDGGGSSAVDTTVSNVLAVTVVLPTASANLDMTLKGALVEIV